MKNQKKTALWALLPFTLLVGSFAAAEVKVSGPSEESIQGIDEKLTSFEFDSSGITTPPAAVIPTSRLSIKAFDDSNIVSRLIQTKEPFRKGATIGSRRESSSPTWSLETDPMTGSILILRNKPSGPAGSVDETSFEKQSLERLDAFGIPSTEVLRTLQKKVMRQDLDGKSNQPSQPVTHRFKTFVFRGINGIPVIGHRAVVSYGVDGAFHRALVQWPAVASKGHLVRTKLSPPEIEARAKTALAKEGERAGRVKLRWMYVPVPQRNGEVVLKLMVGAAMKCVPTEGMSEEPRLINVELDATE
jgi:hypothetical protein